MGSKDTVRKAVRTARRTRSEQRRHADAGALAAVVMAHPAVAVAATVAAYASTPTEPGTGPLRAALAARGVRVLLPVVRGAGPLGWVVDGAGPPGSGVEAGAGGGAGTGGVTGTGAGQDADGAGRAGDLREADVVLLPALAVTADGHRLGQGGGHYDRTLADLAHLAVRGHQGCSDAGTTPSPAPPSRCGRRPLLVALVHDDEVLPPGAWAVEAHDVRVDAVAAPGGWAGLAGG